MERAPRVARKSVTFAVVFLLALAFLGAVSLPKASAQNPSPVTNVGPFVEQIDYGASSGTTGSTGISILGPSCVFYIEYVECVGGQNSQGTDISDVFYAEVSTTGVVGPWTETTDYGAASGTSGAGGVPIEWPSCVQYAGYIYCVGGATNSGELSKVFYAQLSLSGGVGPWTETTDYGASSGDSGTGGTPGFQYSCVAYSGYIYCVGNSSGTSKVFYAALSSSGVGPWTETTDYGASSGDTGSGGVAIGATACTQTGEKIICVGGTVSYVPVSDVFVATLSADGVGPWTETTDYGAASGSTGAGGVPIYGTACAVYPNNSTVGTVICAGGDTTGSVSTDGVHFAEDPFPLTWITGGAFPIATYWLVCVVFYGSLSSYFICAGGLTSKVYAGEVDTGTSASSSSMSAATSSSSTTSKSTTSSETTTTTPSEGAGTNDDVWIGVGIIFVILILILLFLWLTGRLGGKEEPPVTPPPPPPPVTPPPPPPPPTTTLVVPGCVLKYYWEFEKIGLSAAAGGTNAYTKEEHSSLVPIPLAAKGYDSHIIVQECYCTDTVSRTWLGVDALARFDWEIGSGGGGFVQASGGSPARADSGQQVLYQPPEIAKVSPDPAAAVEVKVQVTMQHNDPSKEPTQHAALNLGLHLRITRTAKDKYVYEWWPADPTEVTNPVNLPGSVGDCKNASTWKQGSPINALINGAKSCAPGDHVRFQAKADDNDVLAMQCIPGAVCKRPDSGNLAMSDTLNYEWKATRGKFDGVPTGNAREIVWQAPAEEGVVEITLRIVDSGKEFVDQQLVIGARIEVRKPSAAKL